MKLSLILLAISSTFANASLVGIMDSGTDVSHKDLQNKVYINKLEKKGRIDQDGDGLPADITGFDFTRNLPFPFDPAYVNLISNKVKNFFKLYAKYETGKITPAEIEILKKSSEDQALMNQINFIGSYIHGTHVAGISVKDNSLAKIFSFKILPTVFDSRGKTRGDTTNVRLKKLTSVDEINLKLSMEALNEVEQMKTFNKIFGDKKFDVVNQSFGISSQNIIQSILSLYLNHLDREPTKAELISGYKAFFGILVNKGNEAYDVAPETLFLIAAGNDSSDNDKLLEFPGLVTSKNKIVVAATLGYEKLADFSNFGAFSVDLAAPGVAINSTAPANNYIPLSGTSQATPYVTNILAAMKDTNPLLKAADLKKILLATVDVKEWLKDKVLTSGIANRERAIKASVLSRTMSIDSAITSSLKLVSDVEVPSKTTGEGFVESMPKIEGLNFKPVLPSLIKFD